MKATTTLSTLLALITLSSTAFAAEPVTVSAEAVCPPDTTQLDNPQGFGVSPRPGIVLSYTNTTAVAQQVFVSLVLPDGTTFLALRDAPSGVQKWRSSVDNLLYDAPIPTDGTATEVGVFFTLGASASGSFTVVIDDFGDGSVQLEDYSARVAPDTFVPDVIVPGSINTNSCPTPLQVLKCLGSNTTCGMNRGYLAGITFGLTDAGDAALSPPAAPSAATGANGLTFVALYTDAAFLNGADATNDSYPLRGVTYTITETLPADTLPDGPFWSSVTGVSHTLQIPAAVAGELGFAQTEFVNDCSCTSLSCQVSSCQLKTDGSGTAECVYAPTAGACDDFEPDVCAVGGECFEGECIAVTPSCDTMTFFGVVENADDSLGSFECQITTTSGSESIVCRVASGDFAATGELLLGGPQCVANEPPVLNATQFALDTAPSTQVVDVLGFDPNGDPLTYSMDDASLPADWTLDPDTGVITIAANAVAGTYVINVTVSDGLALRVFAVTVVLTTPTVLVDKQVFVLPLSQSAYGDTGVDFANRATAYGFASALDYVDALCQVAGSSGTATNNGSTWRAWISDASADAIDRITDGRYVRTVDGALIANGKADLIASKTLPQEGGGTPVAGQHLHAPIKYTHNGVLDWPQGGGGATVATGTLFNGRRVATSAPQPGTATNCQNWTSNGSGVSLTIGINAGQDLRWTDLRNAATCQSTGYRIYCFEQ